MSSPQKRRGQKLNIWSGRLIPLIVLGGNGYEVYVVMKTLAIDYLLRPAHDYIPKRTAAGIAIIVLQFVFLFPVLTSWFRFFLTLLSNTDLVPLGHKRKRRRRSHSGSKEGESEKHSRRRSSSSSEKPGKYLDRLALREGAVECPPGLDKIYAKDAFTTGDDGVPRFCNHCWNWKPDRAHHCGELGRCVKRFDHYCPWVGGAVSENNYKFFIQFTSYATIYAAFLVGVLIWGIVKSIRDCRASESCESEVNGNYIGALVTAAVFGFMAIGIAGRFSYFVLVNRTTIEELSRGNPRYSIAVRISPDELPAASQTVGGIGAPTFGAVPYPFRARSAPTNPNEHLFAILQPKSGANVWDVGYGKNWRSIMGDRVWDWFVPLKRSPIVDRKCSYSDYSLGKDFEALERAFLPHRYDENGKRLIPLER